MPLPRYRFFGPRDASLTSSLTFTARRVVEGIITGQHKSPHRGFSVEFAEHREYSPGDELRHLDWRALARTDRYYVKQYEQETNLRATIVLDTSNSMRFAGKLDYARHLAACLAYLLASQQDLAGFVAVDESIKADVQPGSSPAHLDRLFRELERVEAASGTDLPRQLQSIGERLPRRSLLVIISDLWTDPDALRVALQHLRYRKHQAVMVHLLDRAETTFTFTGRLTLQDLESGDRVEVEAGAVRDEYVAKVTQHLEQLRRTCADSDVEYHDLFVDEPYERGLLRFLHRRR